MKMFNGHFIWLWADTTITPEFYDPMLMPFGLFGVNTEEKTHASTNSQINFLKSDIEEDFYDAADIIQKSHIADLIERKMDFEFFDSKQKQNRSKIERKDIFNAAHSGETNSANEDMALADEKDNTIQNMGSWYNMYKFNISNLDIQYLKGDLLKYIRTNNVEKDSAIYPNHDTGATHRSVAENVGKMNQNASEDIFVDIKIKRAEIFRKYHNVSSDVLFHHFQDFPVGLLAMRPIMMKVDRHFIRSTIRLFASTWAKIEQDVEIAKKLMKSKLLSKHKKIKRSVRSYENQSINDSNINVYANEITMNKVNSSIIRESNDKANDNMKSIVGKRTEMPWKLSNDKLFVSKINEYFLNSSLQSNNRNNPVKSMTLPSKQKRQQTWWSTKGYKNPPYGYDRTNTKGGAPRYRHGCYGTINRGELKKAELFTR